MARPIDTPLTMARTTSPRANFSAGFGDALFPRGQHECDAHLGALRRHPALGDASCRGLGERDLVAMERLIHLEVNRARSHHSPRTVMTAQAACRTSWCDVDPKKSMLSGLRP